MTEETQEGAKEAPKNMVSAYILSVFTGFFMVLSVLFAVRDDIDSVLSGAT